MYHLHLQPSEIENLEYYEYWYFVKDLSDFIKKQNDGQRNQEEQTQEQYGKFKQPKMPSMKMPTMKMPKL